MINGLKIDLTRKELQAHLNAVAAFWEAQKQRVERLLGDANLSKAEGSAYNRALLNIDYNRAACEAMAQHIAVDEVADACGDETFFRFTSAELQGIDYPIQRLQKDVLTDEELRASVLGQAQMQEKIMKAIGSKESLIEEVGRVDKGWS